jgi:hypothetical protein
MAASDRQLGRDERRRQRVGPTLGSFGTALEWYDFTLYLIGASLLILVVLARLPETYRADIG